MNSYLILLILVIGNITVSSLMEYEKKSMNPKYSKQTLRSVEKLRRRFKLPKRTSVEKIISYYRMYHGIVDQPEYSYFPAYYATQYRKRSSFESQKLLIL